MESLLSRIKFLSKACDFTRLYNAFNLGVLYFSGWIESISSNAAFGSLSLSFSIFSNSFISLESCLQAGIIVMAMMLVSVSSNFLLNVSIVSSHILGNITSVANIRIFIVNK